jgi:hypothetical protein
MEDVEARNRQQVSTIKAFEEKCRRLYDTRLAEYAERTDQQLSRYEDQLLEAGSALVAEKSKFDSKQRRLKIACNRWKVGTLLPCCLFNCAAKLTDSLNCS